MKRKKKYLQDENTPQNSIDFFFKLRIHLKFPFFCRKLILKCIQYLDFIIFCLLLP